MTTTCLKCGTVAVAEEVERDFAGMCPACLAGFAFETPEELQTLGKYRLTGLLGSGGMSVVYRADDPDLGRAVAIKVLRPHLTEPEQERFRQEARLLARMRHPNIVPIHDYGIEHGWSYTVMELVQGRPLSDHLNAPRRDLVALVRKVALAVQHLHEQGILHRDLKPANILVDERFEPRVADFGIAKSADASLTPSNALLGTPAYMSPEQAKGDDLDARSDVHALGAVLYECLAGRPLFEGKTPAQVLDRVLHDDLPAPPAEAPLARICRKALEKDRTHRYRSAAEFADDLGRYLEGKPVLARRADQRTARLVRRWATPVLVVLSAGTLVYFAMRPRRDENIDTLIAALSDKDLAGRLSRIVELYRKGDYRLATPMFGKYDYLLASATPEKLGLTPAQHARLRQRALVYFALCQWRSGRENEALRLMKQARDAGFVDDGSFDVDDAFRAMRDDPRFTDVLPRK
ncbi:MAG: serine/threonine protein kinase [Planctomycetes bacterium]|nr:serine/threonine protein kinase [Planctomycetota bacterium]